MPLVLESAPGPGVGLQPLRPMLSVYLRFLHDANPPLLQTPVSAEPSEALPPFLTSAGLHLPVRLVYESDEAHIWYRAAVAHAGAHLVHSRHVFIREGIAPITQALLGLLEDTRAEALAWQALPGLRRLWKQQHRAGPDHGDDFESLLLRLSRAFLDPDYEDPHPWVCKGRASFWFAADAAQALAHWSDPLSLRRLASALGHDIGQLRMGFNARLYRPRPDYRDDNRWLWHSDEEQVGKAQPMPQFGGGSVSTAELLAEQPAQWRYPEWDRRIGRFRPDWCSVTEWQATEVLTGDALQPTPGLNKALVPLLHLLAAADHPRWRDDREGDEIALDAALQHAVSTRQRIASADQRLYRRAQRMPQSVAAMLLLDTSASSAQPVEGAHEPTALALHQRIAVELASAMQAAGWRVAVQGFSSAGRHRIEHRRVLDFGEPWCPTAARRLAGLEPALSTRLGAALRHATRQLGEQPAALRLIVLLSDAEPHDVDIHEAGYLEEDARAALQTARAACIHSVCLLPSGMPKAEAKRVFGREPCVPITRTAELPHILRALQRYF